MSTSELNKDDTEALQDKELKLKYKAPTKQQDAHTEVNGMLHGK